MQLNTLKRTTKRKKKNIVGRGGKRGTTAGRGTKGQRARSGHRVRPEIRDLIKKLPKMRGRGKNIFNTVSDRPAVVNLERINKAFASGATVNPKTLIESGLVSKKSGKIPAVKILGTGNISFAITVEDCILSDSAREKITAKKGTIKERAKKVVKIETTKKKIEKK
jgi:large subunit ribosomal protein L15